MSFIYNFIFFNIKYFELTPIDYFQIREWRLGRHRLKSKVEIDPAMPKDAGYYECQADNKYAIDRRGFLAKYELN